MATQTTASDTTTRRRYARGEGDRLRIDLLESAAELMADTGTIEGTSLRAVARHAGVSPTAVYRHFDDHLDLLRQSVEYCWLEFKLVMQGAIDGATDAFDAFERCGQAYVDFAMNRQGQYRVMFSNRVHVEGARRDPVGTSAYDLLVEVVTEMLRILDDDRDPHFVAVQVHTWIHGIVDLVGCHPDMPWPPIDDLLDGLSSALGLVRPTTE